MVRRSFRQRLVLSLAPGPGLLPISGRDGGWCSSSASPWFDLIPENGRFPSGWVLLDARLMRKGKGCCVRLRLDLGKGFEKGILLEPPLSAKGILMEVVLFPKGVRGIRWEIVQAPGEFEQSPIGMTEITGLERIWRMGRRIVPQWTMQPRKRRKCVGLTTWRIMRNLAGAYHTAGLFRRYAPSLPYDVWIQRYEALSSGDHRQIQRHMRNFAIFPLIRIVVPVVADRQEALQATLHSLNGQLYRNFTVTVMDMSGRSARTLCSLPSGETGMQPDCPESISREAWLRRLNEALAGEWAGDYILIVPAGDILGEHALYWVAAALQDHPDASLIYTDDDEMSEDGERTAPRFKPDWSPEHLRSTHYIGRSAVFRCLDVLGAGGLVREDCWGSGLDLLLRMSEVLSPKSVLHIPAVLYHRRTEYIPGGKDVSCPEDSDRRALISHLIRCGVRAEVTDVAPGCFRLRYALPEDPPLVSIMIPTRDAVSLLRQCVESIFSKTTYPRFELLVVDNQSGEAEALDYLNHLGEHPLVRILRFSHPFNYSAINNFAARQARGDVLCLLNNDTEVISPDWLEEMVGRLVQPLVGVVGAKLYYPDGLVQHGGVVVGGGGCADHLHALIQKDTPGYCNRAVVAQELSAVTAACMVTWKHLYEGLGGLNEVNLKVAFNDVDYCLKVQKAGYRVLWTPHAELFHHESASRGGDDSADKRKRTRGEADFMRKHWSGRMEHDPYYNPNLNYERLDFSLSNIPRVVKPWTKG